MLSPIESGASTAVKPFRDAINWVGDTFDAQDENDQLEAEVEALRGDLAEAQKAIRDTEELAGHRGRPGGGRVLRRRTP